MTEYLGISMCVAVTGLVIAVLARLVTGGILDEIERIRHARFERRIKLLVGAFKDAEKWVNRYMSNLREAAEMDEKYRQKGEIDVASKMAKDNFKKTMEEWKTDHDL